MRVSTKPLQIYNTDIIFQQRSLSQASLMQQNPWIPRARINFTLGVQVSTDIYRSGAPPRRIRCTGDCLLMHSDQGLVARFPVCCKSVVIASILASFLLVLRWSFFPIMKSVFTCTSCIQYPVLFSLFSCFHPFSFHPHPPSSSCWCEYISISQSPFPAHGLSEQRALNRIQNILFFLIFQTFCLWTQQALWSQHCGFLFESIIYNSECILPPDAAWGT